MKLAIALCTFAAFAISAAARAGDEPSYGNRVVSADAVAKSKTGSFDVFIDQPTGYAFVNTPKGWKFTRKVKDESPIVRSEEPGVQAKKS